MSPVSSPRRIRVRPNQGRDDGYSIQVGRGLLGALPARIRKLIPAHRYFLITDNNVARLHGRKLCARLQKAGLRIDLLSIPAGEASKSREVKARLEDRMLARRAGRDTAVLAMGGGVVCDLAGFVAATYHRGIPFLSIPTSLLAMVDAAIGGKTGVNHPRGKNLIGAFHHPRAVFADIDFLKTLPLRQLRSGLAEVVKSAVIGNARLFADLEKLPSALPRWTSDTWIRLVAACCRLKASIVGEDARETNRRMILNFGHTVGHAIEQVTRYRVSHGEAVAMGMMVEARAAVMAGIFPAGEADRLERLLLHMRLPTTLPSLLRGHDILVATYSDKKSVKGRVYYVLPRMIGVMSRQGTRYSHPLPTSTIRSVLEQR